MQWSDHGIVLSARALGDANAVVELLTRERGRHLGLVRGGRSRRMRPLLQPGNLVAATWRARLSDHLGTLSVELIEARAAHVFDDPQALAALATLCELSRLLAEREPHLAVFEAATLVLRALDDPEVWPPLLVRWELSLLRELGFGLDLRSCVATGELEELIFVSPRSGRAVSAGAGADYADKLLSLPPFLVASNGDGAGSADIAAGFRLTGYFLERHVLSPRGMPLPAARDRLMALLAGSEACVHPA